MKISKIPMGLAVGLVLALLKVHKGKNPTFSGKLGFLLFLAFSEQFVDKTVFRHCVRNQNFGYFH